MNGFNAVADNFIALVGVTTFPFSCSQHPAAENVFKRK